jgi:hypothetical protein
MIYDSFARGDRDSPYCFAREPLYEYEERHEARRRREQFIAEIKKAAATQDKKRNLYLKIVEWFERQEPVQHAADIFDVEKNEFREESMMTLLEKMHVIQ